MLDSSAKRPMSVRKPNTRERGKLAEQLARDYAESSGWRCIGQNVYSPYGEIDLIFCHQNTLIFCEVKARQTENFGAVTEMVSVQKQQRIILTAQHYLQLKPEFEDWDARFDVAAILWKSPVNFADLQQPNRLKYELQWIENAFTL